MWRLCEGTVLTDEGGAILSASRPGRWAYLTPTGESFLRLGWHRRIVEWGVSGLSLMLQTPI
ncbi:hypothetical protein AB0P05_41810 [Streptomyces flaveolus]|uniref:hypothetical protein n=1 Tax=Streptomyces flaveolus TaxID=67297 RepID=UPI003419264E